MKVLFQPAWLACFIIFALHQFSQKVMGWKIPWADNYLDCLLCMPIFLTFILIERRFLFQEDYTFSVFETTLAVVVLSLIFEIGFPFFSDAFTGDILDVLCYFLGGVFFYFFINKK